MKRGASEALMHLDGCHFYVWVVEHGGKQRIQWSERVGSNLYLHGDPKSCARCSALSNGATASENIIAEIDPPLPRDGKKAFARILEIIAADERMIT